jgi:hypothetical protein
MELDNVDAGLLFFIQIFLSKFIVYSLGLLSILSRERPGNLILYFSESNLYEGLTSISKYLRQNYNEALIERIFYIILLLNLIQN